jgi:hypothetical protein
VKDHTSRLETERQQYPLGKRYNQAGGTARPLQVSNTQHCRYGPSVSDGFRSHNRMSQEIRTAVLALVGAVFTALIALAGVFWASGSTALAGITIVVALVLFVAGVVIALLDPRRKEEQQRERVTRGGDGPSPPPPQPAGWLRRHYWNRNPNHPYVPEAPWTIAIENCLDPIKRTTAEEIAKSTGVPIGRVKGHLAFWVRDGRLGMEEVP